LNDPITWYFQIADKKAEKIIFVFKLTRRFGVAGMKAALDLFIDITADPIDHPCSVSVQRLVK
jgi:hypothetical protein